MLVRRIGHQHCLSTFEHTGDDAAGPCGPGTSNPPQVFEEGNHGGIPVHCRNLHIASIRFPEVQDAVVGESWDEKLGDFSEYLSVVERGDEQSAGFGEQLPRIVDAPFPLEPIEVQQRVRPCRSGYVRRDDGVVHCSGEHSGR